MSGPKKDIVVVEAMSPDVATKRFEEWKRQNPQIWSRLRPADIIVDTIRAQGGRCLRRYRIIQG